MILEYILIVLLAIFLIAWLIRFFIRRPEVLSRGNLSMSFYTMGILALILIAFIFLCVMLVRAL